MMIVSKQNLRALTKEMFLNLMNEKGLAALEIIRNFNKKEREKNGPNIKAREEFNNIPYKSGYDDHFDAQWKPFNNDHELQRMKQEKSFFEWCSLYDDLKHIKKTKEVN
jgi:hypothetical protein